MNDIITPADDPVGFHLDWRHRVATAASRVIPCMGRDPDLKACFQHLHHRPNPSFDRITLWHSTATGRLLEAYLVTGSPVEAIAVELGLTQEDVRLYCAIFWAVRDQDRPIQGVLARLRADLRGKDEHEDDLLRLALLGLDGLRGALGMGTAPLDKLVDQELTRRVMSGKMRTSDLVRLQSNAVMGRRLELESQDPGAPMRESLEFMQHLMSAFAPRMKPVEQTPEEIEASNMAIRARLDSQKLATGIGITQDAGGEKRLDSLVKAM